MSLPRQKALLGQWFRHSVVSPVWMEHSVAGCLGKQQGTGGAPGVRAWHTCTQPCPAADSLPGSGLLNPEILQFPHPQKCCHLLPDALFSFQGCCGWGGWAGSAEGAVRFTLHGAAMTGLPGPNPAAPTCLHTWQSTQPEPWALSLPGCTPADWERRFQLQGGQSGTMLYVWVFSLWRTGNRPEECMARKGEQGP